MKIPTDNRNTVIKFRVNEKELKLFEHKFRLSGFHSKSDFIRTMIFEGVVLKIDEKKFQDILRNVIRASANVNQVAVRVNSTGNIYADDIKNLGKDCHDLQMEVLRLSCEMRKIMSK